MPLHFTYNPTLTTTLYLYFIIIMVAVNALLAISLASLSLTPSADAAAIRGRAPDAGSPTKSTRQRAPVLPMPMMKKAADKGKHREGTESISKRGKQHQAVRAVSL